MVDPSVKGNNSFGVHNNTLGMPSIVNPLGPQTNFNPPMSQSNALSQPYGQQTSFNPLIGQSHILNQSLGQGTFNSPMGQPNCLPPSGQNNTMNNSLNQHTQPNIYNPAQSNSFYQPTNFGQSSNLNQQPTFQPIQSNVNNFSQVIPPSPNIYNQRAPSGKLKYLSKNIILEFLILIIYN